MITRRTKKFYISEKDEGLFTYLHHNKVATVEQINRDVFINYDRSGLYRQLKALVERKYLDKIPYLNISRSQTAYSLNKKTLKEFIVNGKEKTNKQIRSSSPAHDLVLVDLQYRLKKLKMIGQYFTENFLKFHQGMYEDYNLYDYYESGSDACTSLLIKSGEHFVAIEYEASCKTKDRYQSILTNYWVKNNISGVLYICKDDAIKKKIMDIDNQFRGNFEPKILYQTLSKVLNNDKHVTFINGKGEKLVIE